MSRKQVEVFSPVERARPGKSRRTLLWIGALVLATHLPLAIMWVFSDQPGRGLRWDIGIGLGFVATTFIALMFLLTARFRRLAAPFGIDLVYYFHRQLAIWIFLIGLVHMILLIDVDWRMMFQTGHVWAGIMALLMILFLVASSILRRRIHLEYDIWRRLHLLSAILAVFFVTWHLSAVNHVLQSGPVRIFWLSVLAGILGIVVYVRIVKPLRTRLRPWKVSAIQPERGHAVTLTLTPDGHPGFEFLPGQFIWLNLGGPVFSMTEHPFSISSSAAGDRSIAVTIKALGDFTTRAQDTVVGTRVYVDGPYGVFSIDLVEAQAFTLIAGGIGIAPMLGMLQTLADRRDARPVTLIYCSRDRASLTGWEILRDLEDRLNFTLVLVLNEIGETGVTGQCTIQGPLGVETLKEILGSQVPASHYFLCGPPAMMQAVDASLRQLGVPDRQIHSEVFNLV